MIRAALCWTVFFASQRRGNAQTHPVCEVCGCNWCPPGFRAGEPGAIIVVPNDLRTFSDNLTEVPCNLIENLGLSGRVPRDLCTDAFRLSTNLREVCGCPPLPPVVEPTNIGTPLTLAPTQPVAAPFIPEPTRVPETDRSFNDPASAENSAAPSESPAYRASGIPSCPPSNATPTEAPSLLPNTIGPSAEMGPSWLPHPVAVGKGLIDLSSPVVAKPPTPPTGKAPSQAPEPEPSFPPLIPPALETETRFREGKGKASSKRRMKKGKQKGRASMKGKSSSMKGKGRSMKNKKR